MAKEKKEDIIKKYLPDALIITGVYIFSYSILTETTTHRLGRATTITDYEKLWAVLLVAIGINIVVRRYISYKSKIK